MIIVRPSAIVAACLVVTSAFAQDASLVGVAREARAFQQERRDLRAAARAALEKKTSYALTLGAGYTRLDEGGHVLSMPFAFAATTPQGTTFKMSGDGYNRISIPGETVDGFADVEFLASRKFFSDTSLPLRLGGGVKLGTGGAAGSDSDAVFASASHRREWAADTGGSHGLAVSGKARRDVNNVPAGVRPTVLSGSLTYDYTFVSSAQSWVDGWFAQIGRAKRMNARGSSYAVVGAERAITKVWIAEASVYRGLTRGARDTAIGIDLTRQF